MQGRAGFYQVIEKYRCGVAPTERTDPAKWHPYDRGHAVQESRPTTETTHTLPAGPGPAPTLTGGSVRRRSHLAWPASR